jgi:hypothetical protein
MGEAIGLLILEEAVSFFFSSFAAYYLAESDSFL